jgi:hypothetical protein
MPTRASTFTSAPLVELGDPAHDGPSVYRRWDSTSDRSGARNSVAVSRGASNEDSGLAEGIGARCVSPGHWGAPGARAARRAGGLMGG